MYEEKDIVIGSVWQSIGGATLRVIVDISDAYVGYKYVMSSDGMSRTAEQTKKEFLEHHTLFYTPRKNLTQTNLATGETQTFNRNPWLHKLTASSQ